MKKCKYCNRRIIRKDMQTKNGCISCDAEYHWKKNEEVNKEKGSF